MGYESHYSGYLQIDKTKWDNFCKKYRKVEIVSEKPTDIVFDMMPEEWEWEDGKLLISSIWAKHYQFHEFLDEVVKILDDNCFGYFDWHGEDWDRISFYLKKDHWEELEWKKPKAPNWWNEKTN